MFSKEFLTTLYDSLVERAEKVLEIYDPCKITNKTCLLGRIGANLSSEEGYPNGALEAIRNMSFCCTDCQYLGENGCKTKCISCKTWLCSTAEDFRPEARKKLSTIREEASQYHFLGFRMSREDNIETAYNYFYIKSLDKK